MSPPRNAIAGGGKARPRRRARRLQAFSGRISAAEFIGIAAAVFVALGVAWWIVTALELIGPLFLPSPGKVVQRLDELAGKGHLLNDMLISIYRISVGFLISTAFALPIGILIGCYRTWEAAIEPLVDFIRYMPVVAFI